MTPLITEYQISDIRYRFFTYQFGGESGTEVLVLQFAGSYRYGSEGTGDGMLMQAITECAMRFFCVDALLFDFRELDYEWGNNIFDVFDVPESYDLPYATVVSDRCRKGFKAADNKAGSRFFDDFEVALQDLRRRGEEQTKRDLEGDS